MAKAKLKGTLLTKRKDSSSIPAGMKHPRVTVKEPEHYKVVAEDLESTELHTVFVSNGCSKLLSDNSFTLNHVIGDKDYLVARTIEEADIVVIRGTSLEKQVNYLTETGKTIYVVKLVPGRGLKPILKVDVI